MTGVTTCMSDILVVGIFGFCVLSGFSLVGCMTALSTFSPRARIFFPAEISRRPIFTLLLEFSVRVSFLL